MLNLKYSHPHTFYISAGIILLSLGAYPLYQYSFIFSDIPRLKLTFLLFLVGLGTVSLIYGENLWRNREKERKAMFDIRKDITLKDLELKRLEVQKFKEENELKVINDNKNKEYDIIKSKIIKLTEEIEEKNKQIYDLKEKEIKKITPNIVRNGTFINSLSGSPVISGAQQDFLNGAYISSTPYSGSVYIVKSCQKCNKIYTSEGMDKGYCLQCSNTP
ncbi:MAG: hypothetical protein AABW73_02825 [Nanoarchaeota archaeon]